MSKASDRIAFDLPYLPPRLIWAISVSGLLFFIFRQCLYDMYTTWMNVEEYSHAFFIPLISAYFLRLRRYELEPVTHFRSAIPGLLVVFAGIALLVLGTLATLKTVEQYAFVITVGGLFMVMFGVKGLSVAWVPWLFLFFMVPFPAFILNNLSSKLQLVSSMLGVEFIRACDIMVYLEGNVIDLGGYKLQVVDACSGLRYLFPLTSLSFLCAYLFKAPFWQKAIVFLSSIPLTVFMNSFRIGVIGVLVNYWGTEMAEGFLHDFEGWIIFVFCFLMLFVEMHVFSRINGRKTPWSELVTVPDEWGRQSVKKLPTVSYNASWMVVLLMMSGAAAASQSLQQREDIIPERKFFLSFPEQIGLWRGSRDYLAQNYLDALKLTDYIILNFRNRDFVSPVNFYVAYYATQRKGASVHSPKACLPGDGWRLTEFGQRSVGDITMAGVPLRVNRAVIEKGDSRQLVYYWFYQRGRMITNEYSAKWYLFYDAVTKNRTDGSLIRLVTPVPAGEDLAKAEQRLQHLMNELVLELIAYLPGGA